MSDPVFVTGYGQFYYTCDRDPTSSEPLCYTNIPSFVYMWYNSVAETIWWCVDNTADAMVWQKSISSANISSYLPTLISLGLKIGSVRSYSARTSPAFNTAYTPSTTNDCFVITIVNVVSTLVTPGTVLFQVNDTGSYVTRGEASISGVASSQFQTISAIVPIGKSYQMTNTSGTASIISINELLL